MVVFVPFTVPGDVVDLQVRKKKHHYCEAEVIRFIKKSDVRAVPMCGHFGVCGGCKWQNLPYEEQLKAKQQQVFDQLSRIGRSEEHTSELQSRQYLVCRLLLEKKNK